MPIAPDMTFRVAASEWLRQRAKEVSKSTARNYEHYVHTLNQFLGDIQLRSVSLKMVHDYRKDRVATAGPSAINHEINTLTQILRDASLWEQIKTGYHPLDVPKRNRVPLTEEEELKLFKIAGDDKNPKWKVAYLGSMLVAATGVRAGQIRALTIGGLDLRNARIRILQQKWVKLRESTRRKRPLVERWVTLDEPGLWAARQLLERALEIGATAENDYLLPANATGGRTGYDISRPQRSWKRAWDRIRRAAEIPNLQVEDLRYSAITRILAKHGIPQPAHPKIAAEGKAIIADTPAGPEHLVITTEREETDVEAARDSHASATCTVCPRCRYVANSEDRFCARCGTRLAIAILCPACGASVYISDAFCRGCGRRRSDTTGVGLE